MSLIYGGFRFLTSTGNPAAIKDARDQILAGFLGLVIIFGSYVILNEINPDLISLRIPQITAVRNGIILYNSPNCADLNENASIPELIDLPQDIKYKALKATGSAVLEEGQYGAPDILPQSLYSFVSSDDLTLELYQNDECAGDAAATITDLQENQCHPINIDNVRCIKFVWYIPGIWVFNRLDDSNQVPSPRNLPPNWTEGKNYLIFQDSQNSLPGIFHDRIQGIAIVPNKKLRRNYGIVTHNIPGGLMKEKGWADIFLGGCPANSAVDCRMDGEITIYGPLPNTDASSLTIFALPETGGAHHSVTVCRQDRCEPQRIGDDIFDVRLELSPGTGLDDVTSNFGSAVSSYNSGQGIIYAKNFDGEQWDSGNDIVMRRNNPDGISAVTMQQGAHYLVLLCEHHIDDFSQFNSRHNYDVAIINQSLPSARTIQMDGRTGTIIVIRTHSESN